MSPARAVRGRPAETAGGAGGLVAVVAAALGGSTTQVAALAAVAGSLPGCVTFLVTHGGVRGLWRSVAGKA